MAKEVARIKDTEEMDILKLLAQNGIEATEILDGSLEIGDGWEVIDKASLVGVPFVLTEFRFHESDKFRTAEGNRSFVICKVITAENMADPSTGKFVFTDGGTGIHDQLGEWLTKSGREVKDVPPMFFKKGLTVSNYDYTDDKGNVSEAHTYYLP